jgi:hypothetical protein
MINKGMRKGWDATRRNRNIGTENQGYSKNNEMAIPLCGFISTVWEKIINFKYKAVVRQIGGKKIVFIVEKTRKDTCHACTIDDICLVLKHVPEKDLEGVSYILLRQPNHKEEMLEPVWGKYFHYITLGPYQDGAAVTLETYNYKKSMFWPNSLTPDDADEVERLKQDGHPMVRTKRGYKFTPNLETVRAKQLYRTLLHEIGHHVDYTINSETIYSKTSKDKEVFAHSYATKMKEKLTQQGVIPFSRLVELEQIEKDGLDINDFVLPAFEIQKVNKAFN